MRNASIILGLLVGSIIAGATGHMNSAAIDTSPAITFLWVETFKLSLYPAAIIPGICVFTILAVEATGKYFGASHNLSPVVLTTGPTPTGDITASAEASRLETSGPIFDTRVQGGIAADGLAGLTSGLMTMTPVSIFAQNSGKSPADRIWV